MDKATFLGVLQGIVEEFESPAFKSGMAEAKAKSDVGKMVQLPMDVQEKVFSAHKIDLTNGAAEFKEAGKRFGLDLDAAPWLARMKAALGK